MDELLAHIPDDKKWIVEKMRKEAEAFFGGEPIFPVTEWKGYKFPPAFNPESAKYAFEKLKLEEGSVFVASFPKTGTNWLGEIVRQIFYGHDEKLSMASKSLPAMLPMLEAGNPDKFQLLEYFPFPIKLFATHLPEELFNFEKVKKTGGKVIIIFRNPKDQAVSWFHFSKNGTFNTIRDSLSSDWSQFLSDYIQGKHPLLTKEGQWYPEYLLGWYKHRAEKNVLFIQFEDMKKDIKKEIRRIGTFLDIELTSDRVDKIAESTSFDSMKKGAESQQTDVEKARSTLNMIRKGQVGGWKNIFTVAQSEAMDKAIEDKLGKTDIKFTYEL